MGGAAPHPVFTCAFPTESILVLLVADEDGLPYLVCACAMAPQPSICGSCLGNRKWDPPADLLWHPRCRWHKLTSCHWVWSKSRGPHYDSPGLSLPMCFGLRNQASLRAFHVYTCWQLQAAGLCRGQPGTRWIKRKLERHTISSCHSLCPEVPSHSASLLPPCIILFNRMLNYLKCLLHLEEAHLQTEGFLLNLNKLTFVSSFSGTKVLHLQQLQQNY